MIKYILAAASALLLLQPTLAQMPAPAVPPAMQQSYARDPHQPLDQAYTAAIAKYTTEPYFNSPLTDYLPASKTVPTPIAVLGDVSGAPAMLPYAEDVFGTKVLSNRSSANHGVRWTKVEKQCGQSKMIADICCLHQ